MYANTEMFYLRDLGVGIHGNSGGIPPPTPAGTGRSHIPSPAYALPPTRGLPRPYWHQAVPVHMCPGSAHSSQEAGDVILWGGVVARRDPVLSLTEPWARVVISRPTCLMVTAEPEGELLAGWQQLLLIINQAAERPLLWTRRQYILPPKLRAASSLEGDPLPTGAPGGTSVWPARRGGRCPSESQSIYSETAEGLWQCEAFSQSVWMWVGLTGWSESPSPWELRGTHRLPSWAGRLRKFSGAWRSGAKLPLPVVCSWALSTQEQSAWCRAHGQG